MRRMQIAALMMALMMLLGGCGGSVYVPTGEKTGNNELDAAVLDVIEAHCQRSASMEENLCVLYDWVRDEIGYRAAKGEGAETFTDEIVTELAAAAMARGKGDCDSEAALMAVFLRRMGVKAKVVKGRFLRGGKDGDWVEHAWVVAVVEGKECHFDPLYDRYFADEGGEGCFMAEDAQMQQTHDWQ